MPEQASFFPPEEFEERRRRLRARMSAEGLDALLIATPENIYYLSGLDHMGYFAFQLLILPLEGTPILVTRAMERAVVADQAPDLRHYGYTDGSTPDPAAAAEAGAGRSEVVGRASLESGVLVEPAIRGRAARDKGHMAPVEETCRALAEAGLGRAHLGLEEGGSFLSYRIADGIKQGMSDAAWTDRTGIVEQLRNVQSPLELQCTRRAAVISDAMMQAGMAAAGYDMNKRDIMAAIYDAMFHRGGTYPGFVPLVRSNRNLAHEHGTWDDERLETGEILFLEMSGCVRRYHAPMGRLAFISRAPDSAHKAHELCAAALLAAADAIRPGVAAGDVYEAWQSVLNLHGLESYRRHHCGYSIGIGYPPSWSGGGVPIGLRADSDMELRPGMVFHLMSWLLHSDHGDSFMSDTVVVTPGGCEFLTKTPHLLTVRD